VRQVLVWGAISRSTGRFIIRTIPSKRKSVLKEVIETNISNNSTIYSDEFSSYMAIFQNNEQYNHGSVNHRFNFVNPRNGVHTQNIENLWSRFKKWKNKKGYSKRRYIQLYASEYTLFKQYDDKSCFKWFRFLMQLIFE
jgi:transposase-like protein